MTIDRMDRIQELIRREISRILQSDINDESVRSVTVTRVQVTRDLRMAKVFYRLPMDSSGPEDAARALKHAAGYVRRELAERVSLKYIPRISFREDDEGLRSERLDELFSVIEDELGVDRGSERGENGS